MSNESGAEASKPSRAKVAKADKADKAAKAAKAAKTASPATAAKAPKLQAVSDDTVVPAAKNGGRTREDKDHPLFQDIRYLGRLLGDVLREQEGDAVFDVVETIRQTAVRFRREDDSAAAQTLDKKLRSLSPEQTVSAWCAHSAISRTSRISPKTGTTTAVTAFTRSPVPTSQPGTIAHALERLVEAGAAATPVLQQFFNDALIVPVLTAHPTEVQRKSILDAQHDVARLLAERDQQLTPRERAHNEAMLRARVTSLWQTRMLRDSRLSVADEIENALSYYRATFLDEIPALYADIEDALARARPAPRACRRSCRWAAGSAATATAIRTSRRTRSSTRITRQADRDLRTLSGTGAQARRGTVGVEPAGRRERGAEGARRRLARPVAAPHATSRIAAR